MGPSRGITLAALLLAVGAGGSFPLGGFQARAQGQPAPGQALPSATPRPELRGVWLTANDMPVLRDRERMQHTTPAGWCRSAACRISPTGASRARM